MNSMNEFTSAFMTVELRGPVVVARISKPSLSDEENIEEMGKDLNVLVEYYSCRKLVVDLQTVGIVTSAALGKLISLHRNLHRREGNLVICGARGMVRDVMEGSRLTDYFKMTETPDEAEALLASAT